MYDKSQKNDTLTPNSLTLTNQKKIILTGIQEVYSTNDKFISLKTNGKKLMITGENITITKLLVDSGELEANGNFDSIKYSSNTSKKLFNRIFK